MTYSVLRSIVAFFNLGGQELLIIMFLLGVPVAVVLIVLAIVRASQKPQAPPPLDKQRNIEDRLNELETLRTRGALSDAEYETQRRRILDEL